MQNRKVNVDGEATSACAYMIRLDATILRMRNNSPSWLGRSMTPEQFRSRFGYLVGLK